MLPAQYDDDDDDDDDDEVMLQLYTLYIPAANILHPVEVITPPHLIVHKEHLNTECMSLQENNGIWC